MLINVGHLTYYVARPTAADAAGHPDANGLCEYDGGRIVLFPGMSPQKEAATLVHEVLHGMFSAYAIGDTLSEEEVCMRLEGPLLAFLADNPQVIAALIAARGGVALSL